MRLDTFLNLLWPELSRTRWQRLIRQGRVRVEGKVVTKPGMPLSGGEKISVTFPGLASSPLTPEPLPIPVLYEDDALLVVNKPRGMIVHPVSQGQKGTLVNALIALGVPLSDIAGSNRPGIIHRLDKGTSGVLVVAKTNFAHLSLARQFAEHTVEKRYLALVVGEPDFDHRVIAEPLTHHPEDPKRIVVVSSLPHRPFPFRPIVNALTEIWVRDRFSRFALVEVRPVTGRTHQIRVHLKHLGLPVVGDETYNGQTKALRVARESRWRDLERTLQTFQGQALHAWRLTLRHPRTREQMTFEAPLPPDIEDLLEILKGRQ